MSEVIIPNLPGGHDSRELNVLRKQTLKLIQEAPTSILLNRGTKQSNGTGGWTTTWADLDDPQDFRMIQQGGNVASRNVDGEQIKPAFVMIGMWDADVENGDKFVLDGRNYDVIYVRRVGFPTEYETWVEVVYRG